MRQRRWMAIGVVAGCLVAGLAGPWAGADVRAQGPGASRVFELRTYAAQPGKFEAMKARFREHIIPLFAKHGLALVGFWTYADAPASENTLVYILAHESREAAQRNWAAFIADPVRVRVWAETERDGPINLKVDSVFLSAIDFSPIQ